MLGKGLEEKRASCYSCQRHHDETSSVQSHPAIAAGNRIEQNPSEYYRVNVYYPFIDHVLAEIKTRFSDDHKGLIAAQNLVPVHLNKLMERQVDAICTYYGKFMTYAKKNNLVAQVAKWKKSYHTVPMQDRPDTAISALAECSLQTFSALCKVLTIFHTIPVGSVSCERSFSVLRRLKLCTRFSTTEERLSDLAMMLLPCGTNYMPTTKDIYKRK